MLKYRRFLPYLIVTPSQHVREKLKLSKPFFKDHHSPILESLEPQPHRNYPQEIYEPMFQSDMYQMPEIHDEPVNNDITPMIIANSPTHQDDLTLESMQEELENSLLLENEIENAIDEASMMPDEAMNDSNAPIEEIMEEPVPLDDVDNLENMLDDPMQPDIMYDIEQMMPDPFHNPFYFNHMF